MLCPNCGAVVAQEERICSSCGFPLNPQIGDTSPPKSSPTGHAMTDTLGQHTAPIIHPTPSTAPFSPPNAYSPMLTDPLAQPPTPYQPPQPSQPQPMQPYPQAPGEAYPPSQPSQPLQPSYGQYGQPALTSNPGVPPGYPIPPGGYAPPSQPYTPYPGSMPLGQFGGQLLPSQPLPGQAYTPYGAYGAQAPGGPSGPSSLESFLRFFGPSPDADAVRPTNAVQRRLQDSLPQYATSPITGAVTGALVAAISCIFLTFLLTVVVSLLLGSSSSANVSNVPVSALLNGYALNLVATEHHASLVFNASGILNSSIQATLTLPLTLLIVIPAISLALGGYISASTDYTNQLRYVLIRAAAVGPVYGLVMTLIVGVFGTQTYGSGGSTATLSVVWLSMLFYSVLFGSLFALIGGLIKIFGKNWRIGTMGYLLSRPHGPLTASFVGALAAIGTGLLLSVPIYCFVAGSAGVQSRFPLELMSNTNQVPGGVVLLLLAILSLPGACIILAMASGASLTTELSLSGVFNLQNSPGANTPNYSLLSLSASNRLLLLAVLIPAIAYFVGGRVAIRMLSPQEQRRLQVGALVGLWGSALMFLLISATSVSINLSSSVLSVPGLARLGASLNLGSVFLGTLVIGTCFGALGAILRRRDYRLVRRPSAWGIAGIVLSAALGILALVGAPVVAPLIASRSLDDVQRILGIFGGLMLAAPAACFAVAMYRTIAYLPPGSESLALAVAPSSPVGSTVSTIPPLMGMSGATGVGVPASPSYPLPSNLPYPPYPQTLPPTDQPPAPFPPSMPQG